MKVETLLDRLYAGGHWLEFGEDSQIYICRAKTAKPMTQPQKNALRQHGPAIYRRACKAVDDAKDVIERAMRQQPVRRATPRMNTTRRTPSA